MRTYDRARQLAGSGRYENAREVLWVLFKEGYSLAGARIGPWRKLKLTMMCRASIRRVKKVKGTKDAKDIKKAED